VSVDLPSGVTARMSCRRIRGDSPFPDGVVHVKLVSAAPSVPELSPPKSAMYLPGLVGSGVIWLRACREAEALYHTADWFTLEGEPGVGKLALARAVHQRRNPAAPFHVLDAASANQAWLSDARHELLDGQGVLVIRHVEALNARQVHALASALTEARTAQRQAGLRVAITLNRKQASTDLTRLLRFFLAPSSFRRCAITSRTCMSWCPSSWPG
jgi:sigma-54 dependent transcriptional regulator, acetoin dehydrogenase operon transcriptional activator AcoR